MKKNSGFTLLELLITVAVLAMVMAIGVPAMTSFIQNDRLTTNINTMVGHLAYARSEAVKRSQQVALCASSDGTGCNGGWNWHVGWIVYVDVDGSGIYNAGDEILRVQQALGNNNVINASTLQYIYDYRGYMIAGQGTILDLCDNRSGPYGKQLWTNNIGRVRLETKTTC